MTDEVVSGYSIGVDIGGTFTDCAVVAPDGGVTIGKVLTTPEDRSVGFFGSIGNAASKMGLKERELVMRTTRLAHGTTVGINALVTRSGAKVGLLATKGHGDAIRIMDNTGRITGASIEEMLDYARSTAPEQFIEREMTKEITERIDFSGEVVVQLDEAGVAAAVDQLVAAGATAIAICYLWSHVNPIHELRTKEILQARAPDLYVSCSCEVAPRIGEYPRTATTIMNVYIGPLMERYVDRIVAGAKERGYNGEVLFATSEGGLVDTGTVKTHPISTCQSGPVSGVLGCAALGPLMGFPNVISTDMGGTSLDASVIEEGRSLLTDETVLERHQLHLRKVDVESIGAGGGSIAWFDEATRTIKVGPQSSGAVPGPACYGRGGTDPTVTDADLMLGILDADRGLAGGLKLDLAAAEKALGQLGARVGLGAVQTAAGIVEIIDSRMEDLLRRISLQKGHDPRDFVVWAFGGAAGMHASLYSRGLGITRVVVPMNDLASVWSAYGIAISDLTRTFQAPLYLQSPFDPAALAESYHRLEDEAKHYARQVAGPTAHLELSRTAEIKYAMQWYSVEVDVPAGAVGPKTIAEMVDTFDRSYEKRYGRGSAYREAGMTLSNVRVTVRLPWSRPPLRRADANGDGLEITAAITERPVFWLELKEFLPTPVYEGKRLPPQTTIDGPAVVEYPDTTVAVRPGQRLLVDGFGNLVISMAEGGAQ